MRVAVITAKVVLEQEKGQSVRNPVLKAPRPCPRGWCRPTGPTPGEVSLQTGRGHRGRTIRCLYSSEASCTAVSHMLGLEEYTLPGSSFQYLENENRALLRPLGFAAAPLQLFALPSRKLLKGFRKKAASGAQGTAPFETSTRCRN